MHTFLAMLGIYLYDVMKRLGAASCTACRGRGHTPGVFHRLPCPICNATGFVQHRGRCVDTVAAEILASARRRDESPRSSATGDAGTPDQWTLRNNYRGD